MITFEGVLKIFCYLCSMIVKDYLKLCSVKSVDELSDEQVVAFFNYPNMYIGQRCAVRNALANCERIGISRETILKSMRRSMAGAGEFNFYFVSNESADGQTNNKSGWVVEP